MMRPPDEQQPRWASIALDAAGGASATLRMDDTPAYYEGRSLLLRPNSLVAGALIAGRYRVERELGRGGFGVVYQAFDEGPLQRRVALKVIRLASGGDDDASRLRRRFLDEARTAGGLSHPHIATVYDVGDQGDGVYMTQELVVGRDLRGILDAEGPLPIRRALELARQICEGMAHAHARGIVHRDLKPANVLVDAGDQIKITDFGLAQAAHTDTGAGGVIVGTPGYMSPEQLLGERVDERADVFAFGCLLYHMVTGQIPFTGPTLKVLAERTIRQPVCPAAELRPDLPPELGEVIARALSKDPAGRHPSMAAVLEDLSQPVSPGDRVDLDDAVRDLLGGGADGLAVLVGDRLWVGEAGRGQGSVESLLADQLAPLISTSSSGEPLRRVAGALEAEHGRDTMVRRLAAASSSRQLRVDPVARELASLPVPLVVTTRIDPSLGEALGSSAEVPTHVLHGPTFSGRLPRERLLVHLFGSAALPGEMIVTDEDLWEFYSSAHHRLASLREALVKRRLLLVGFDPEDEAFHSICLHVAQCGLTRERAVYLVVDSISPAAQRWVERRGIKVIRGAAVELLGRLRAAASAAPASVSRRCAAGGSLVLKSVGSGGGGSTAILPGASLAQRRRAWGGALRGVVAMGILGLGLMAWLPQFQAPAGAPGAPPGVGAGDPAEPDPGGSAPAGSNLGGAAAAAPAAAAADPSRLEASAEFVLAVAPFWGMNERAAEEGRVMQILAEREIRAALGEGSGVRLLGKDVSQIPRSHAEARELGQRVGANAVLWGEILILGDTLEVQPYLTRLESQLQMRDRASEPLQIGLAGADQLRMRKVTAEQLGTMGLFVAGQHYAIYAPGRALELFRRVRPATAESVAWQGEALLRQGHFAQAEATFRRALELDPDHPFAHARLAWIQYYDGRIEEGLDTFRRAAALDPDNARLLLNLALLLDLQGEVGEALPLLRRAQELDPAADCTNRALINALLRQRRYDDAMEVAEALRGLEDGEWLYLDMGSWILGEQGRHAEADALLQQALRAFPGEGRVRTAIAWSEYNQRHLRRALNAFHELSVEDPTNQSAHFGVAISAEFLGDLDQALEHYRRFLELNPMDFRARHALSRVLVKLGDLQQAVEVLKEALRRAPPAAFLGTLHLALGEIQAELGNLDEAVAEFSQGIRLQPTAGTPYLHLGALLEQAGRLEEAAEVYAQSSRADKMIGDYLPLFRYVAQARLGQPGARESLAADWQRMADAGDLGWPADVYRFLLGDLDEAGLLEAAAATAEDDEQATIPQQEAWYYIGMRHRIEGRPREAAVWLQRLAAEGTDNTFEARTGAAELARIGLAQ